MKRETHIKLWNLILDSITKGFNIMSAILLLPGVLMYPLHYYIMFVRGEKETVEDKHKYLYAFIVYVLATCLLLILLPVSFAMMYGTMGTSLLATIMLIKYDWSE